MVRKKASSWILRASLLGQLQREDLFLALERLLHHRLPRHRGLLEVVDHVGLLPAVLHCGHHDVDVVLAQDALQLGQRGPHLLGRVHGFADVADIPHDVHELLLAGLGRDFQVQAHGHRGHELLQVLELGLHGLEHVLREHVGPLARELDQLGLDGARVDPQPPDVVGGAHLLDLLLEGLVLGDGLVELLQVEEGGEVRRVLRVGAEVGEVRLHVGRPQVLELLVRLLEVGALAFRHHERVLDHGHDEGDVVVGVHLAHVRARPAWSRRFTSVLMTATNDPIHELVTRSRTALARTQWLPRLRHERHGLLGR